MAAELPAAAAVLRALLLLAVVAELRVLRAHKPRVALALLAVEVVLLLRPHLAVEAVLRVVLPEVVVAPAELLSRPSFSAARARTTHCPAPAPTYERVPRSR